FGISAENTCAGERGISAELTIRSPCRSLSRPIAIPVIPISPPALHGINKTRLRQRAVLMSVFKRSGAAFRSAAADRAGRRMDAQGRRQDLKTPVEQALMRG